MMLFRKLVSQFVLLSFLRSFVLGQLTSDTCGEVNEDLTVTSHGRSVNCGRINACICVSGISGYISSSSVALKGVALAGQSAVSAELTVMIKRCPGKQCQYPPHSVPICAYGNPCSFTCKDGYTAYPPFNSHTCVCSKPYTECNGKCGIFHGCPSQYKRDLQGRSKHCPWGHTACGIYGRGPQTWECVDTQYDLESCGGCMVSLHPSLPDPDGVDCTAIPGISDVSCIGGKCVVHRCMAGYELSPSGLSCYYTEEKDPVILAAQYGLEHVPL